MAKFNKITVLISRVVSYIFESWMLFMHASFALNLHNMN